MTDDRPKRIDLTDHPMCDYCRGEADGECTCPTASVTTDKPSIAELQAGARRRMGTTTLQDYDATGRDLLAAAPVLLEIAAAALALRQQEQIAAKARRTVYAKLDAKRVPSDSEYAATDVEDRKLKRCRDDYNAALAKVRP